MEADWPRTRTRVSSPVRLLRQRLSRLAIGGERSGQDMMVDQPRYKTSDEVDFVIVGSGAAGGVLAKELSSNGFSVVVLEQGPYLRPFQFRHDEATNYLGDGLLGRLADHPHSHRPSAEDEARPAFLFPNILSAKAVGGSSLHFSANFWRFRPVDFR